MIVIKLPAGMLLLNKNQRLHRMEVNRRYQIIKNATIALCNTVRPIPAANIKAVIHPDVRTPYYDAHNFHMSVAAAVDGLVKAKVLPNDDVKHLPELTIVGGERVAGWQLELRITPLPGPPATR